MSDENAGRESETNSTEPEYFYRDFTLGDFEVTLNFKRMKSPVDILEKLQQIHEDESLTSDEKNKKVQIIMNEYLE